MKTFDGKMRVALLTQLMAAPLSIHVSNAVSERGFSILRKIHTDQRPSLKHDTIIDLMTIQFNSDASCFDSVMSFVLNARKQLP